MYEKGKERTSKREREREREGGRLHGSRSHKHVSTLHRHSATWKAFKDFGSSSWQFV